MKHAAKCVFITIIIFIWAYMITSCGITGERVLNGCEKIKIVVSPGDTLWDLSIEYCPANVDVREWINEVKNINGITYLKAWQEIVVLKRQES